MGKKKQQKQYQLNHKKNDPSKIKFNTILKQLSQMKQANASKLKPEQKASMDLGLYKKKIKKQQKLQKYLKNINHQAENNQQIHVQPQFKAPKVNIFETNAYDSGVKTIIKSIIPVEVQLKTTLQDRTKKIMQGNLNFQKFGQKPLKVIEQAQKVQLSDDQDQPNTIKNITHSNLLIPQGNYAIQRTNQINQFRQKLPIYMKEQQIIQTINNHIVTLICGQTGSGKSTQIGQFLIQKNYHTFGKIAITQPRRLATISLASRVAKQTNTKLGEFVGYQVRHDRKDSAKTLIKFLTDGILLNEMSSDTMLSNYSVVVIDQAHERKVNTDILIGLLSKLIIKRYLLSLQGKCKPLRLIIMSATMRVQDFQNQKLFNYFVPIINVQARMFPVSVYYQKNTPQDYKQAAVKTCMKIHKKLPPGDVLVFLTGKQQIHEVAQLLQQTLQKDNNFQNQQSQNEAMQIQQQNKPKPSSYLIYCLYSSLPMAQQQKIFDKTPQGCRKFVISTNIAQTSITIPNIRYVIDSGQQKHRYHEGVWRWRKGWGSRAMAEQRAGRAGRTTHGYCYRLYSSALYANIMQEYPLPQIMKLPLQSVILQLKSIGVGNIFDFSFPTIPQKQKIISTLQNLIQINALQGNIINQYDGTKITQLGKVLSFLPLDPKLGKILLQGRKFGVQKHCLLMVILLTVQSLFLENDFKDKTSQLEQNKNKTIQILKSKIRTFKMKYKQYIMQGHIGDIFTSINILGQFFTRLFKSKNTPIMQKIKKQSHDLQLNQNVMRDIYYNTDQIAEIYQTLCGQKMDLSLYQRPNKNQIQSILHILLDSFLKNLCRFHQKNKYVNKNQQTVYIHHLSDNYLKNNLFLCCTQFFSNDKGKNYMRYAFPVTNFQLLASYGKINPPTQFAWRNNEIVGLTTGTIFNWQIPSLFALDVQTDVKYFYVAKFLLQGEIYEALKVLNKYLKASPSIIKPDNLDHKVQKLVQTIRIFKISNINIFNQKWKKDRFFLKKQLKQWVNMQNYDQIYQRIRQSILNSVK